MATSAFNKGDLIVSKSIYAGAPSTITVGNALPTTGVVATNDGTYPTVFNNNKVDANFGITAPIYLDRLTASGTFINSLNITAALKTQTPTLDISTSFPSKSELALNLSSDGKAITFIGYSAPVNLLDISNTNTPGVIDPTNTDKANPTPRTIVQVNADGTISVTPTNAYSGNNGRAVVLANGLYYEAGNAGNDGTFALPITTTAGSNKITTSTANLLVGEVLTGASILGTLAGTTTTKDSNKVTATSTTNLLVGDLITGTNILPNTKIVSIDSATGFTISSNATATGADAKAAIRTTIVSIDSPTQFTISSNATAAVANDATAKIGASGAILSNSSNDTGLQLIAPGATDLKTTVVGAPKGIYGDFSGYQNGFSIADLGLTVDKTGKDDNFRGLTYNPFDGLLYLTKGSGGNGVNTVYKVTPPTGGTPTAANATTTTIAPLAGFPTGLAADTATATNPFGMWFADKNTLYVADEGDGTAANAATSKNAGLQKWSFDSTANKWVFDYTLQNGLNLGQAYTVANGPNGEVYPTTLNPATDGLRNITGKVNTDGTVTVYGVTSTVSTNGDQGADPNKLVAITDKLAATKAADVATETFSTVEAARYGEVLRGISLAPTDATLAPAPVTPTPTPIAPKRNVIVFVADGLRPGSINATDTPTLFSIRQNGVNFTNSHSLFPTFTTPNASAIATGHYLGDTGDFSNTVYTGYPVINANGSVTPFIENDPILADINAKSNLQDPDTSFNKNNFLTEETLLAYARLNGYDTAAIGKLGPVAIQDPTQDIRTTPADPTTKNITPTTVIIDDSTYINSVANATTPPTSTTSGSQLAVPLSTTIANALSAAGLIGTNVPGAATPTVAAQIASLRSNQSSGNLTTAGTLNSNAQQQQYFADATTKAILPQFVNDIKAGTAQGFAAVYWSRDPDGTQHNNGDAFNPADPGNNSLTIGINGPTSKKGAQDADANLAQLIAYLKATPDPANPGKTLYDNTDLFVTADHGFSTISKQAVGIKSFDANGVPTYINTTSYAASLSYYTTDATTGVKTPTVHAGFLPPGFVAIDLAKDLGATLYDPNAPSAPVTTANINSIQYNVVDPTKGQLTASGNGVIGGTGKVTNGVIDAGTKVVVAANGGSDLLYVPSNDPALVKQIVNYLSQKDYISGIFTDDKFGDVPGALKLSTIGLQGTAELPTPSIVINFKTFSTNPNNPNDPQTQVEVADTTLQQGQGMHGSFGRGDTFNNMAAIGPDFKTAFVDTAPVSNADVTPTLAKILGWTLPDTSGGANLIGRVATEALVGGPATTPSTTGVIQSAKTATGSATTLDYQTVGGAKYFDAAGIVGGTDGLTATVPAGQGATGPFKHVLVISVDGLHNSDLNAASLQSSLTNIKRLQKQGITYANSFSAAPSDSFPGELNYITGADPGTTGVFYDKSYSRTLYAPGTTLAQIKAGTAKPGTDVEFAENVDATWAKGGTLTGLDASGKAFDLSQLPVDSNGNPVYPNQYIKPGVNTIFDVASQAGLATAWSDKHPAAYTILAGPSSDPTKFDFKSGKVGSINDYYSLEINAPVAIDTTKQGPLSISKFGALVDQSTGTAFSNTNPAIAANFFNDATKGNATLFKAPPAGTTAQQFSSYATTSTYDDYKVKAILNEIDGLDHSGTVNNGDAPALFGLNLQAVSVAEKEPGTLFNGGGFDSNGNARPDLVAAVNHVDQSVGLILDELKAKGLDSSTLVVLTAKHGQNPTQDPTVGLSSTFNGADGKAGGDGNLTAIGALLVRNGIQIASERGGDTSSLIYLVNQADTAKAVALLNSTDPNKYSFDTTADTVSDPSGKTLFSAEDFAAQGTVLSGQGLINAGLGDPTKNDRSPDIAVALNTGYFFGKATSKRSEHGGFTDQDTHVATIVGSAGLPTYAQGTVIDSTVSTQQIAVTALKALGLDASKLTGAATDGTQALPGVPNVDPDKLVFASKSLLDLRDKTSDSSIQFTTSQDAAFKNYVGIYRVDSAAGDIDGIKVGDAKYIQAALNRSVANLYKTDDKTVTVPGNGLYASYLISNGTIEEFGAKNPTNLEKAAGSDVSTTPHIFFSFAGANTDGFDHVKSLGNNMFGFEDTWGGGDKDFNDAMLKVSYKA
jgi:arylsulfatase A-like enzyme